MPTPEGIAYAIGASSLGVDGIGLDAPIHSPGAVQAFYRGRGYSPAWFRFANPGRQAWEVLEAVRSSRNDGLDPHQYHEERLDSLLRAFQRRFFLRQPTPAGAGLRLELLLTDAYLTLGDHLLSGCVRPAPLADPWHIRSEDFDLPAYLQRALVSRAGLDASLQALAPPDPEYARMKKGLAAYRKMEASGGWPRFPEGPKLGIGDTGSRIGALCRRLRAEGYLEAKTCSDTFTVALQEGVRMFQSRHGLDTTGSVGHAEIVQLDIGAENRIQQIRISLEIWRWLPRDPGPKHVRVNIADFRLAAFAAGQDTLDMKAVVGRKEDRTPLFVDRMIGIALNPPWNVPADIAREEIVPGLLADPGYLAKHDMELLRDTQKGTVPIDPDGIDWSALPPGDFPYRVRQRPGAANALGKIKFVLTNPFNVYLHDTPASAYFQRNERAFSHGCVRVEKPLDLALWALYPDPEWNRETLPKEIEQGRQTTLSLPGNGIPVYILYRTAFPGPDGGIEFRRDIYGWDAKLGKALGESR